MMCTRKFIRDNGDIVEADFSYRIYDDTVDITECDAWLWEERNNIGASIIDLSGEEIERLEEELTADPETWRYDYDD